MTFRCCIIEYVVISIRNADPTLRTPGPGFNSVQGPITDRHQGIIVYEHDQSYPAYLVTYSVD